MLSRAFTPGKYFVMFLNSITFPISFSLITFTCGHTGWNLNFVANLCFDFMINDYNTFQKSIFYVKNNVFFRR